jgi:hypothetical protein
VDPDEVGLDFLAFGVLIVSFSFWNAFLEISNELSKKKDLHLRPHMRKQREIREKVPVVAKEENALAVTFSVLKNS